MKLRPQQRFKAEPELPNRKEEKKGDTSLEFYLRGGMNCPVSSKEDLVQALIELLLKWELGENRSGENKET